MIIYNPKYSSNTAIIQENRSISYKEFYERIDAVAGIAKATIIENNVAIEIDNRLEAMEIYLGLMFAGKTVLPLPSYLPKEFSDSLKNRIGISKLVGLGTGILDPSSISYERELLSSHGNGYEIDPNGGVILMTSGTEGPPKIMKHGYHTLTHRPAYTGNLEYREVKGNYRCLSTGPLDAGVGVFQALWYFDAGSEMVLDRNRMTAENIVRCIKDYECNMAAIYNSAMRKIIDMNISSKDLPSLKSIVETGSPPQEFVNNLIIERFGDILYNLYASSELGTVSSQWMGKESGGNILSNVSVNILNKDDSGIGEIWGNNMAIPMQIFNSNGVQDIARSDYLTSGDFGYINDNGQLVIAGRRSDKIITSGYKVYAGLIEREINSINGIYKSAVIGIPDEYRGQKIIAYVDGEITPAVIQKKLSDKLPFYMIPKEFKMVDSIPQSITGKILKRELVGVI